MAIAAPLEKVWEALLDPNTTRRYMFGATVVSDWKEGAPIQWKGVWRGIAYEDKGIILDVKPLRQIRYTHFSPLAGVPDVPENYHHVTIELEAQEGRVHLALSQDNNPSEEECRRSERTWNVGLSILKDLVEA